MKTNCLSVTLALFCLGLSAYSQGAFSYDQQSGTTINQIEGGGGTTDGQSFTPSLPAVGFFQVYLASFSGGTIQITLRDSSPLGSILGSSDAVMLTGPFSGVVDFVFSTPVTVTPNATHYFQPVSQSGSWSWGLLAPFYATYSGGTAFFNGVASPNNDFWFREGIVVPEPSSALLILCGAGFLGWTLRRNRN
jgi:PEP-CTERM motif